MCRIFWSAGIATARAASITRSTSLAVTSRSLIATMPCELSPRMWLPAMPACTDSICTSAISSASSIARWIDWTVDSMLTTTPFLSPRDGCVPRPMISISSSFFTWPTIATTFEVPMSSPTMMLLSPLRAIYTRPLVAVFGFAGRGSDSGTVSAAGAGAARRTASPCG